MFRRSLLTSYSQCISCGGRLPGHRAVAPSPPNGSKLGSRIEHTSTPSGQTQRPGRSVVVTSRRGDPNTALHVRGCARNHRQQQGHSKLEVVFLARTVLWLSLLPNCAGSALPGVEVRILPITNQAQIRPPNIAVPQTSAFGWHSHPADIPPPHQLPSGKQSLTTEAQPPTKESKVSDSVEYRLFRPLAIAGVVRTRSHHNSEYPQR
jgi:hypothetical protein